MHLVGVAAVVALWEAFWWARRFEHRRTVYQKALALARHDGVPLIVVGAPDQGPTPGPGCGDVTIDILGSGCPVTLKADITKPLPFPDNSAVVFVSCVLEYVGDYDAALQELKRVSGGRLFVVRVEPWTLAAFLYPETKRRLPSELAT